MDATVSPIDYSRLCEMPGIIGYVVKEDDTLWSLAKKYYTTAASIKKINELDKDELLPGKKLIIVGENITQ